jgi:hypothetical protein
MAAPMSAFDQWAPLLRALGFCPLPIIPGEKVPGEYLGCGKYRRLSDWSTRSPIMSTQPGAGLGLRLGEGLVGIDIDTGDEGFKLAIMSKFVSCGSRYDKRGDEWKTISRIGRRGELFFLRTHPGRRVASRKFPNNGRAVIEVLASGTQCVLPPTTHPNTNQPYRWGENGWTFFNTDLEALPEWSA